MPPYHYLEHFIIWEGDKWRLLSSSEREVLHGYGFEHTSLAYSASVIKKSKQDFEDERKSLIGDSFSIFSFCYFAAQACRKWVKPLSYSQMVDRMGMAPGFSTPLDTATPIKRALQFGIGHSSRFAVEDLNRCILRRVNHTGSDVRVATGSVLNPKAFPRQSVPSQLWKWENLFNYQWKKKDHINSLELRAILHAIQWHVTHLKSSDCRIFHLSDSYSKGRTSSKMLSHVLKRLCAWLLAFQLFLVVMHVESADNPTDEGSRLGSSTYQTTA